MRQVLALAALALACTAPAARAEAAWITVGDAALGVLQKAAPQARTLSSTQVQVTVPKTPGPAARSGRAQLVQATEGVHVVELDDSLLPALSEGVHRDLRRCGGFVRHASLAEALAVLHRLQGTAQPLLAPSYAIDNQAVVTGLLPQLQASNLLTTIGQLAAFQNRRYNSSHGVNASAALLATWQALNPGNRRDVKVRQLAHTGFNQKSVEFEITGSGNSGETVILGAHLDSITGGNAETGRAPGADDDASGVAGLTEVIRVLMANGYIPRRNIRFIAYAGEEAGLLGSQQIAAQQALRRDKVVGVMQLDMTAFQGSATDIWIYTDYTDPAQNQFVANLASTYLPQLTVGYDRCGYGCSDHASWFNRGYSASLPFESSDATYNFALHTPNDTIATFGNQANHALKFTQLALAYVVELASDAAPAMAATAARTTPSFAD